MLGGVAFSGMAILLGAPNLAIASFTILLLTATAQMIAMERNVETSLASTLSVLQGAHVLELSDHEAAYKYLGRALETATEVRNTRIPVSRPGQHWDIRLDQEWRRKVEAFVKRGRGSFHEVVGGGQDDLSSREQEAADLRVISLGGHHTYGYSVTRAAGSAFVNFTLIDYQDRQEVVIGWGSSVQADSDHRCYVIQGSGPYRLYLALWNCLWAQGEAQQAS
jgi:hypothetical protein